DRGITDGLDQMDYQRLLVNAKNQSVANDKLPGHLHNNSLPTIDKRLQRTFGVNSKGQPLDSQGWVLVLTPSHQAQANAAAITSLSLVGRKEDLRKRTNAYEDQRAAYAARGKAFDKKQANGTATQADVDRLNAEFDRLEALRTGIDNDGAKIDEI